MQNIILDCDGVLLNWRDTYLQWLKKHNFLDRDWEGEYDLSKIIKMPGNLPCTKEFSRTLSLLFNESYYLRKLAPIEGAVDAVRAFHKAGFLLKVVSSYTDDFEAMQSRAHNLVTVFGGVFQEVTSLPLGASKFEYLESQPRDSIFIEDSIHNICDALDVGLKPDNCYCIPQMYNYTDHLELINQGIPVRRMPWRSVQNEILKR